MAKFWNSCISDWEGQLTLHKGGGNRSFMTMTTTIWWPRSGAWIYQIVTGVTSVVGVPSTHLVRICTLGRNAHTFSARLYWNWSTFPNWLRLKVIAALLYSKIIFNQIRLSTLTSVANDLLNDALWLGNESSAWATTCSHSQWGTIKPLGFILYKIAKFHDVHLKFHHADSVCLFHCHKISKWYDEPLLCCLVTEIKYAIYLIPFHKGFMSS